MNPSACAFGFGFAGCACRPPIARGGGRYIEHLGASGILYLESNYAGNGSVAWKNCVKRAGLQPYGVFGVIDGWVGKCRRAGLRFLMPLAYGFFAPNSCTIPSSFAHWLSFLVFLAHGNHTLPAVVKREISVLQGDGAGGPVGCGEEAQRTGPLEKRGQAASDHHGHGQQQ